MSLNRDSLIALFFLGLCAVMYTATLDLPPSMYGQMSPALWPRMILVPLALLSAVLLVRSLRAPPPQTPKAPFSITALIAYYHRPILCFFIFFVFLVTMPLLGMLLGGIGYVFLTLNVLGGWKPRRLAIHAMIALIFVVGMWAIFTLLLDVYLPQGTLLRFY
ncbi:tripartite tricarboxylate transporter TctB family protein [Thalassospira sp.]|uniref:tripartite tricarboxylate transporter TctB family protein n=1 Tax=Thalassospira sp. TaxID=1912094 RepID=UPI003AA83A8F